LQKFLAFTLVFAGYGRLRFASSASTHAADRIPVPSYTGSDFLAHLRCQALALYKHHAGNLSCDHARLRL
jgi:hypothetical protein